MVDESFSMMHHWDPIIKPILEWVKPHRIVEIGVYEGGLTRKLLEYLHANETEGQADVKLIGIDPFPKFDGLKNHRLLELHEDISLNVLPNIKDYQVVIIDGDHNYFTVYNELQAIDQNFQDMDYTPVIICHDTVSCGVNDSYWADVFNTESHVPPEFVDHPQNRGLVRAIQDFIYNSPLPWKVEWHEDYPGVAVLWCSDFPREKKLLRTNASGTMVKK